MAGCGEGWSVVCWVGRHPGRRVGGTPSAGRRCQPGAEVTIPATIPDATAATHTVTHLGVVSPSLTLPSTMPPPPPPEPHKKKEEEEEEDRWKRSVDMERKNKRETAIHNKQAQHQAHRETAIHNKQAQHQAHRETATHIKQAQHQAHRETAIHNKQAQHQAHRETTHTTNKHNTKHTGRRPYTSNKHNTKHQTPSLLLVVLWQINSYYPAFNMEKSGLSWVSLGGEGGKAIFEWVGRQGVGGRDDGAGILLVTFLLCPCLSWKSMSKSLV
ncbi:hypothetical protein Pmani_034478 [Petrolisthes manimaculis]|uniref:Uncharacterized protein n=1 Tax=Petrolisthes manimaculis TaxID=1843537 RepID=A0AAE1TPN1_9EUCA|nr:hypothetical protein Pmani_034478 [Petrolisthes manimaculis]